MRKQGADGDRVPEPGREMEGGLALKVPRIDVDPAGAQHGENDVRAPEQDRLVKPRAAKMACAADVAPIAPGWKGGRRHRQA